MSEIKPVFQGEVQLAGWTVGHSTGAKISFWLSDESDIEAFRLMTARKGRQAGQRLMAVLVQIGDDEQPINPGEDQRSQRPSVALRLSAVQMCKTDAFQQFVAQATGWLPGGPDAREARETQAAEYVRERCRIESRSELDTSPTAAQLFARLMGEFRDWARATGAAS